MLYLKGLCHQDVAFYANKGPSILYQGGGWGLVGYEGGQGKKYGFKGGFKRKKILGLRWGHQKNPSNFAVTAFVIMQTAYQNAKNQRF